MQNYIISLTNEQLKEKTWYTLSELKPRYNWPDKVDEFNCSNNQLISLEDAPKECGKFYCNINMLKENGLKGGPEIVYDVYQCERCSLTSLMYAPMKVKVFDAQNNDITSLEGIGRKYLKECQIINLDKNQIQSNILGIVLIKDLKLIDATGETWFYIKKMIDFNKTGKDVLEAQEWLIEQGKKQLAKM